MNLLLALIFLPIIGSLAVYILPKKYMASVSVFILRLAFLFSLLLISVFLRGKEILFSKYLL